MERWIVNNKETVFRSEIFSLARKGCRHPDSGMEFNFYSIETRDWINVVAQTSDGSYILVRQHRLGTDEITLETPGGLIEAGESPAACAQRELQEETGYSCEKVHLIKKLSVNPAIMNNYLYLYYAPECVKVSEQQLDDAEDIEIITAGEDEVKKMLDNGEINHSIVVMAFALFFASAHVKER